jgi:hypothetical protein
VTAYEPGGREFDNLAVFGQVERPKGGPEGARSAATSNLSGRTKSRGYRSRRPAVRIKVTTRGQTLGNRCPGLTHIMALSMTADGNSIWRIQAREATVCAPPQLLRWAGASAATPFTCSKASRSSSGFGQFEIEHDGVLALRE